MNGLNEQKYCLQSSYGSGCMLSLSSRHHRHGGPSTNDVVIANVSVSSPWIFCFHQLEKNISGSKYPTNILFNFQSKITTQHRSTNLLFKHEPVYKRIPMEKRWLSIPEALWDICYVRGYHRPQASKWEPEGRGSKALAYERTPASNSSDHRIWGIKESGGWLLRFKLRIDSIRNQPL